MNLRSLSAITLASALLGCSSLTPSSLTQLQKDATLLDNGLKAVDPILYAEPLSNSDRVLVESAITSAEAACEGIISASSTNLPAAEALIVNEVDILQPIADKYFPVGSTARVTFDAVMGILPAIAFVPATPAAKHAFPGITVDQSRIVLRSLK